MVRSLWKLFLHTDKSLLKLRYKILLLRRRNRYVQDHIRIWHRGASIFKEFIGLKFMVYNGKMHIPLTITPEMVGHKFGEYVFTRKKVKHNFDKRRTQGGFKKKQK